MSSPLLLFDYLCIMKIKYKLKNESVQSPEYGQNKAGEPDGAAGNRYANVGMEEGEQESGESPNQNPDMDNDGVYSPAELEYHFDLDQDGEVSPDEYKVHVKWHEKHPEVLEINEEALYEKKDRCYRLAKQKYDVFPSAYASGFIVRCRKGKVAKKKKK